MHEGGWSLGRHKTGGKIVLKTILKHDYRGVSMLIGFKWFILRFSKRLFCSQ
jgi:hypothetical protein